MALAAITSVNKLKYRNLVLISTRFYTKRRNNAESSDQSHSTGNLSKHHNVAINKPCIYDIVIVGGGIVGTATARELLIRHPTLKIAILDKEEKLGFHQTGHNSGVIHAGIYYKPGSLKAQLCVKGLELMYKYCDKNKIPYQKCGKLIVATNPAECERLEDLIDRGRKNNVPDMKVIDKDEIKKIEPHCQGLRAIWSPHTGIINFGNVTEYYGDDFVKRGGVIHLNFEVKKFCPNKDGETESERKRYPLQISSDKQSVKSRYAVVCAGLQSDKLAVLSGCSKEPKIVPVRGEYLLLSKEKAKLVKGNIYPVPDPRYPFLGVHFTPRMNGEVWLGPNAILALKREGYRWRDISIADCFDSLFYPGFIRLILSNGRYVSQEIIKSIILRKQVRELQKFIPEVTVKDVKRGPAGVRAQALDRTGKLIDDFVFDVGTGSEVGKRVLHCRNAPSPGATSSLAIAELIAERVNKEFSLNS